MRPPLAIRQFLRQVDPFRILSLKELDRLASSATTKTFAKGETVYSEGDPAENICVVKEGRIQIFKYTTTGRPLAMESFGPRNLFGTLCRLGGHARTYPCTAIAAVHTTILRIPDKLFLDIFQRNPALPRELIALCSSRLNTIQSIASANQEPVERRIAAILLRLRQEHGDTLPVTKREVAELAGTTVETTIRTVSIFSKKGWVSSQRGRIHLKTPAQLKELLEAVS
jgi:CRP/FNR family transcriptional regulator, nitrogen oxide reductase regulator